MTQASFDVQVYPQGPYLGLPGLMRRPRYRPQGYARITFILFWAAGVAAARYLGSLYWPLEHINERHPSHGIHSDSGAYAYIIIPFLIYSLPMYVFGFLTIKATRLRRPRLNSLMHVTWAAAFINSAFYQHIAEWMPSRAGVPVTFSWWGPWVIGALAWFISERYTRPFVKIFYPAGRGHWATEFKAFFKAQPQDVLRALEEGNAAFLKATRSTGPERTNSPHFPRFPEQTTVLIISTCPHVEGQKAYLFLRTYWGYKFSQLLVRATILGFTFLRDVEINSADLKKLTRLVAGFTTNFAAPRSDESNVPHPAKDFIGYHGKPTHRAETANGSLLTWVGNDEVRALRIRWPVFHPLFLIMGLSAVFAAAIAMQINPGLRFWKAGNAIADNILIAVIIAIPIVTVMLAISLFPALRRRRIVSAVASRRNRLFNPDESAVAVAVESLDTFGKMKLLPDDYALLQARRDGLDIEFSRFRARLDVADIVMELVRAQLGPAALAIKVRFASGLWKIVVSEIGQSEDPIGRAATLKAQWESTWGRRII